MTLHYYPETDSLYIELKPHPSVKTVEIRDGLNADLNAKGQVVGFDMERASARFDLSRVETIGLPSPTRRPEKPRAEAS